jgi:multidrug efflux pump subunit AcrA (membrane-fusion protein)
VSVQRYQSIVEENRGEVVFVKLFCLPEILEQRVLNPERKNWKISSLTGLHAALEQTDLTAEIAGTRLVLDTFVLEPQLAAQQIAALL